MKEHAVFTSFSREGYENYARRFVESFLCFWPEDIDLHIFHDDLETKNLVIKDFGIRGNIHFHDNNEIYMLKQFLDFVSFFPLTKGIQERESGIQYNVQTDARMARKAFIQNEAVSNIDAKKVFWIDADVITHDYINHAFLDEVLPDDCLSCFLGRNDIYTESGFIGYNTQHIYAQIFTSSYVKIFLQGTFLTLPAWHDCVSFDVLREAFQRDLQVKFNNLGEGVNPGPGLNVFVNSVLGKYMDHLKGKRKNLERSPDSDLTVERKELHWNRNKDIENDEDILI